MFSQIRLFLTDHITGTGSGFLITVILLCGIALTACAAYWLTKWMLRLVEHIVLRSPTDWDDALINRSLLKALSQLSPAFAVSWMLPGFFGDDEASFLWLSSVTSLYILWAAIRVVAIFIDNLYNAMSTRPALKFYAVKGIFQMVKLIIIGIGIIIGLSILINRSPVAIITALGASAAVLMLVFRDTILGLVASVQLTANNMLHRGDWIVAEKHGANGEVIDVSLTTVKVRNWDNSVSTIPPYSLVSDSFRNFEPMRVSGGRRVERSVYIDANTVRFLDNDELTALEAEGWLDGLDLQKAQKVVNLGLLRLYLVNWLQNDSRVNPEMTVMVRQMDPTPSGLPLQLYFFTRTTEWILHEQHQSEIFDHLYAVVRRFGLAVFQTPAGIDFARAKA